METTLEFEYRLFGALGRGADPTMLRLVCLLSAVEGISPTDFASMLGVPRANTVLYFKALRELGLAEVEKSGAANGRIYRLAPTYAPLVRDTVARAMQTPEARRDVAWFRDSQRKGLLLADPAHQPNAAPNGGSQPQPR